MLECLWLGLFHSWNNAWIENVKKIDTFPKRHHSSHIEIYIQEEIMLFTSSFQIFWMWSSYVVYMDQECLWFSWLVLSIWPTTISQRELLLLILWDNHQLLMINWPTMLWELSSMLLFLCFSMDSGWLTTHKFLVIHTTLLRKQVIWWNLITF